MLNAVSRFLTEGKLSLFPAGVTDPQISAWVMNPSTTGLIHAASQDPPPPVGVLQPHHFLVLPPPNADPTHSLGKAPSTPLSESLKIHVTASCLRLWNQCVLGLGLEIHLLRLPMPVCCVTPSKALDVSECYSFMVKEDM